MLAEALAVAAVVVVAAAAAAARAVPVLPMEARTRAFP